MLVLDRVHLMGGQGKLVVLFLDGRPELLELEIVLVLYFGHGLLLQRAEPVLDGPVVALGRLVRLGLVGEDLAEASNALGSLGRDRGAGELAGNCNRWTSYVGFGLTGAEAPAFAG